jgi:Zn-dependent protease
MPDPRYLLLSLPILILSFTVHEFAHAWVALKQGDDTAYMLGRVTLNPAAHIDPVGTLLLPMIAMLTGAPLLGWAKPVPTTPRKYRNYKRGDLLVSIAGVVANFGMAIVCTLLSVAMIWAYRLAPGAEGVWNTLLQMFDIGVRLNILLILFNLIPIPPLDGSRVLVHFLSPKAALSYREMSRYGMAVLMLLVFVGGFRFLTPLTNGIYSVFRGLQEVLV